jgi:hypothetical protein
VCKIGHKNSVQTTQNFCGFHTNFLSVYCIGYQALIVVMAINKRLKSELISVIDGDYVEQIWVKITTGTSKLYLCCVYLPPDCDVISYERHIRSVDSMYNESDINDKILICGDFNLPGISWNRNLSDFTDFSDLPNFSDLPDLGISSLTPTQLTTQKEILTIDGMSTANLTQVNSLPNDRNVFLDLFFCNFESEIDVNTCDGPLLPLDRHHNAYKAFITTDEVVFDNSQKVEKRFDFKRAKYDSILTFLNDTDWKSLFDTDNVDECVEKFYSRLERAIELFVPPKTNRALAKKHPWYSRELSNLENRKNKAFKGRLGRTRNLYKKLRTDHKKLNRSLYSSWVSKIESGIKRNPKKFFEFANFKRKTVGYPSSMTYKNKTANAPLQINELFADFFESVYDDSTASTNQNSDSNSNAGLSSIRIELADIETALSQINANKGAGDDKIPPSFVKSCADGLKSPLYHIFNLSLTTGIFPSKWKNSFLVPIFKAGKRTDIGNYRGVAILSCFAKLFEVLVYSRLFFSVKSVITPSQHGFVSGRSTVTNLIEFTSFILNHLEDGIQIDAIYTDFSKAFDKINHRLLLRKLSRLGFGGSFLKWIASYLSDRKQYVKTCGCKSRLISVKSGVPQGSHLGPLLFILFINDITSCFKSLRFLLYADDLKVFFPVRSDEDYHNAQLELNTLSQWCENNLMRLNLSKCKVITYSRARTTMRFDYVLSNHTLERVESIRDLGILLDPKLDFRLHVDELIVRASRMLGYVRRVGKEFKDPYTLKTLYISFVRTLLDYGSCIWSPYYEIHKTRLEAIQKKFLRFALRNLNWNRELSLPPYCQRCRLIVLDTLSTRRTLSCILFVFDVLCSNLDCPEALRNLGLTVPTYNTRQQSQLKEHFHRTNYGQNEPINRAVVCFNKFSSIFEFGGSREVFANKVRTLLRACPCPHCSRDRPAPLPRRNP